MISLISELEKFSEVFIDLVNNSYLSDFALSHCRTPSGHPEGFIEAFANIYTEFAEMINKKSKNRNTIPSYPTIDDGVKGIKFIFAAKKSNVRINFNIYILEIIFLGQKYYRHIYIYKFMSLLLFFLNSSSIS